MALSDSLPQINLGVQVNSPSKHYRECYAAAKTVALGNKTKGVQPNSNRLHEGGLYARRPMVCIPLSPCHRAARRRWAADHRD
ncbi:hypothetical protein TNCV_255521 [Trichonephila clavipes]|nr:hypothetical protein TNCV_255521 [Trichonephila clavipes]